MVNTSKGFLVNKRALPRRGEGNKHPLSEPILKRRMVEKVGLDVFRCLILYGAMCDFYELYIYVNEIEIRL